MIELTEEPYDAPVAVVLVDELVEEVIVRYADVPDPTEDDDDDGDQAYRSEVTPELVRRPHGCFVVAWLDGDPVGCGAVKPFLDLDTHERVDGVGEIKRMYTAPRGRRRGIGRAVLARLEEISAELGYRRLVLETGTAQPEAVTLYASAGWDRVTPYGRYRASPWSVCFAKDLVGP